MRIEDLLSFAPSVPGLQHQYPEQVRQSPSKYASDLFLIVLKSYSFLGRIPSRLRIQKTTLIVTPGRTLRNVLSDVSPGLPLPAKQTLEATARDEIFSLHDLVAPSRPAGLALTRKSNWNYTSASRVLMLSTMNASSAEKVQYQLRLSSAPPKRTNRYLNGQIVPQTILNSYLTILEFGSTLRGICAQSGLSFRLSVSSKTMRRAMAFLPKNGWSCQPPSRSTKFPASTIIRRGLYVATETMELSAPLIWRSLSHLSL